MMFEQSLDFPGTLESWNGYKMYRFPLEGKDCLIVVPSAPLAGRRWLWRARFFNAFPNFDLDMVRHGFYLAHIDVGPSGGGAEAIRLMNAFYKLVTSTFGFDPKCVMEGYSRGSLPAFNWSIRNPDKLWCLYADNPICNYHSWPHLKEDFEECREQGVLDENNKPVPEWNPVDNLAPLAVQKVPIYLVCAEEDKPVPPADNAFLVQNRYTEMGGPIIVEMKPGTHRPHCMESPEKVVAFALKAAGVWSEE